MLTQYSVIRYVPDSARGERINVGVAVQAADRAGGLTWKLTEQTHRIAAIASQREAEAVQEYSKLVLDPALREHGQHLEALVERFVQSLQFSEIMACEAETPADALTRLFKRLVPEGLRSSRAPGVRALRASVQAQLSGFFVERKIRPYRVTAVPEYYRPDFELRPNGVNGVVFLGVLNPSRSIGAALERSLAIGGKAALYRKREDRNAKAYAILQNGLDASSFERCRQAIEGMDTSVFTADSMASFGRTVLNRAHPI